LWFKGGIGHRYQPRGAKVRSTKMQGKQPAVRTYIASSGSNTVNPALRHRNNLIRAETSRPPDSLTASKGKKPREGNEFI